MQLNFFFDNICMQRQYVSFYLFHTNLVSDLTKLGHSAFEQNKFNIIRFCIAFSVCF